MEHSYLECFLSALAVGVHDYYMVSMLVYPNFRTKIDVPVFPQRYFLSRARRVCMRGGDQVPPNIQWLLHPEGHSFFVHGKPVDTSTSSILSSTSSKGLYTF